MSFFSKLNKEFDTMFGDDKKKEKDKEEKKADKPVEEATRAYPGHEQSPYGYGAPPSQPAINPHSQYSSPPPQQYGQPPPPGQYGQPPPNQYGQPQPGQYGAPQVPYGSHPGSQYGSPAPPQQYGAFSPPAAGGIPPIPSLPPGWQALWDPTGQRWAYLEQSVSKVIWNVPTEASHGGGHPDGSRGFGDGHGGGNSGAYGAYGQNQGVPYGQNQGVPYGHNQGGAYGGGHDQQGKEKSKDKSKDDGKKNMMLGAAGGLAAGAVGGVLLANALDGDDNHGSGAPPLGAPLPLVDNDGNSVSSSDREDVEEARKAYEEAYEDAYGSD